MLEVAIQVDSSARGLGWIDLNFELSVCPILPGGMGIWQKRPGKWARWWNTQIKINPTQVHKQMGHPVQTVTKWTLYELFHLNAYVKA